MKAKELIALGPCCACGRKLGQTNSPMFFTIALERWVTDADAIRRQVGLEMSIGALASVMGPDDDLARRVDEEPRKKLLCLDCATRPAIVAAWMEEKEEGRTDGKQKITGEEEP
jgi:hypothetical protein